MLAPSTETWHYAAWVALDLRLLLLTLVVSLLATAGVGALYIGRKRPTEVMAISVLFFLLFFAGCVVVLNHVFHYPAFVIESIFTFP